MNEAEQKAYLDGEKHLAKPLIDYFARLPYEQQRDVLKSAIGKINACVDRLSDPKRWERLSLEKQQGLTELLPIIERLSRPDIDELIYQEREVMVDTFVQLTIYLGLLETELAQEQHG